MMNSSSSSYFIALADTYTYTEWALYVCALLSLQLLLLLLLLLLSISHTRFYYHEQPLRFSALLLCLSLTHSITVSLLLTAKKFTLLRPQSARHENCSKTDSD